MTLPPNPALRPLAPLIGSWDTAGTHPYVPGVTLHGHATFAWIEDGAFLVMRTEMDDARIPAGVAIFASDDSTGELFMLYFDERTVSRKYDVSVEGRTIRWSRSTPEFSQRMSLRPAADGRTMASKGEMSRVGGPWEDDLVLTYTRAAP